MVATDGISDPLLADNRPKGGFLLYTIRTDLAIEAHQLWQQSSRQTTQLSGVQATDSTVFGCAVNTVNILDDEGASALGKPVGTYITVSLPDMRRRDVDDFERGVHAVADQLRAVLTPLNARTALVVGLGNRSITPDAVGPLTVESTMITRHLLDRHPDLFRQLSPVSALAPGVLASTGMEVASILQGVVQQLKPDVVLVIDALASRQLSRLCATVQLCDTGIIPGAGVGNARAAINRDTLGVPVLALGVPTVVDAGTLALDLLEQAGQPQPEHDLLAQHGGSLIVTPKDIDSLVSEVARLMGYALNLSLHNGLELSDVRSFLS